MTKRCPSCNVVKDADGFSVCRASKDGRQNHCRQCMRVKRQAEKNGRKVVYWRHVLDALGVRCCKRCGEYKELDEFHRDARLREGRRAYCRPCVRERMGEYRSREEVKEHEVEWRRSEQRRRQARTSKLKKYGLTLEDYDRLVESQDGRCLICDEEPEETLRVDHCHDGGHVRGLLCHRCNAGLGLFGDDPQRLRNAADYLARTRLRVVA